MKDKYYIIGIISIIISVYKLIYSTYQYLYGPPIYDPNMLYLFMLPEYWFYLADWINYSILLCAGILIFYNKHFAYYAYNIFFVISIVSFLYNIDVFDKITIDRLYKLLVLIVSIFGLNYFNKDQTKNDLKVSKGLTVRGKVIIGLIYLGIISLPIMFL